MFSRSMCSRSIFGVAAAALCCLPGLVAAATVVPGAWTPTWANEFDAGASDLSGFTYETGNNNGWGNNELQNYRNNSANVSVSGGSLHVTAIASGTGAGQTYTSGRIKTSGSFSQAYGLFEFRARMPGGQGIWPAIWMMPQDSAYGGWPTSGEIDVLETRGQEPQLVQSSLHSGPSWDQNNNQTGTLAGSGLMPGGFSTVDWHVYSMAWSKGTATKAGSFKFYVDGLLYKTITGGWTLPAGVTNPDAPFDKPFYLIFNVAVGGNYVGSPNLAPGNYTMDIDYARAYSVPEPGMLATLAGGVVLLCRRRSAPL